MTKLKQILLHIARLSSSDQRWILSQLSSAQHVTLERWQGLKHLEHARRFKTLKTKTLSTAIPQDLPVYCKQLAIKAPLYIAIVIDQGLYPWQETFLEHYDRDGFIKMALTTHVPDIKPSVKLFLFNEWVAEMSAAENAATFEEYLESGHG
jgi:hypothetical protein